MSDEVYEQWRRERQQIVPPDGFTHEVMRRVRQEAMEAPPRREGRTWRRVGKWLDRHPLARVAVIGGAVAAG